MIPIVAGAAIALLLCSALVVARRRRAARRVAAAGPTDLTDLARAHAALLRRRAVERDLAHALEHAEREAEVVALVHDALVAVSPGRPFELHLVDEHEPVLRLAFATGATPPDAPETASPWASQAARDGVTVAHPDIEADDVCPHVAARAVERCSALCIPLLAMGRIVGVLYAFGPVGTTPPEHLVECYETIARTAAAHVATVRAFGALDGPEDDDGDDRAGADLPRPAHADGPVGRPGVDQLTGLPGIDDALVVLDELLARRVPLSLALFDIDDFGRYQAVNGAAAGDLALRTLTDRAAGALRPDDLLFGIEGDRFLAVLPGASARQALEMASHVRHAIARAAKAGTVPAFTACFGIVEATGTSTTDRLLRAAADAVANARGRGPDQAVLGVDVAPGAASSMSGGRG